MRKSIDTYVEVIAHDNARYIIEGEYESVADYCLNCGVVNKYDLIDFFDSSELDCGDIPDDKVIELREYLLAYYNYLPFDDYLQRLQTTAVKITDFDGRNAYFVTAESDEIIDVTDNVKGQVTCKMFDADKVFAAEPEQWQDVLKKAGLQDTDDLRVLRLIGPYFVDWIVIYDDLIY